MSTIALSAESMPKTKDILHSGRLGYFSESAARFISSIDIDPRLIDPVIEINTAHVLMLAKQKILSQQVARDLLSAIGRVRKNLKLSHTLEDVHMNVEAKIISIVGPNSGGMLNLAKSRNDQVAAAIRISLREQIFKIARALIDLQSALLVQARKNSSVAMPGYTHLQRAQPLTLGHYLLAHFDSFDRDLDRLINCYHRVNRSPMGAGALASTGFPIDRNEMASALGFEGVVENSLDAVSARDFATESIFVFTQSLIDLSRFAEELVLWSSKEFSFVEIEDKFTSTSSMMPQKKNAVVAEIARAKAAQALGDLVGSLGLLKSLPLGYNLDLQELTRNLWSASDKALDSMTIFAEMTVRLRFDQGALEAAARGDEFLYATEIADYLVKKHCIPFREAHFRVGALVKYASGTSGSLSALNGEEIERILKVSLSSNELRALLDPMQVLSRRSAAGSPNPKLVALACARRSILLENRKRRLKEIVEKVSLERKKRYSRVRKMLTRSLRRERKTTQETIRR